MRSRKSDRVTTQSIERHDSASKKARVFYNEPESRYRCSFCSKRFASLVAVRDHTRNEHHKENEQRKLERLNVKNKRYEEPGPSNNEDDNEHDKTPIYWCLACTFVSISYDLMIEHCQSHIIDEDSEVCIKPIPTIQTQVMGEEVEVDRHTYEVYDDSDRDCYISVHCDYEVLKNDRWPGNFTKTLTKSEIDKIHCTSIYYFTRIIRFTSEKKTTAPFMLFKCMKCMKYIDPHSTVAHVQENSCSAHVKGFSCYVCQRTFLTQSTMYIHYLTHKTSNADMEYATIYFNKDGDKVINDLLLKAAAPVVKQTLGSVNNIVQQGPEPLGNINNIVQQGPGVVQAQVGVNNTVKQGPGIKQTLGNVNNTVQQAPGTVHALAGVKKTVKQGPGIVNKPLPQTSGITQSQVGVIKPVQHTPAFIQPQVVKRQTRKDVPTLIMQGKQTNEPSEIADDVVKGEATVYKCQCGLCFHAMQPLFKHLESCTTNVMFKKVTCTLCSLVFDEQQNELHSSLHRRGTTKINVKKVTVSDEEVIAVNAQGDLEENAAPIANNTKRASNKDLDTDTSNTNTTKVSKNQKNEVEQPTINEAILGFTKSLLILRNSVSILARDGDSKKFVLKEEETTATTTRN